MTKVGFRTELGDFEVTLADEAAPLTVANFLRYVAAHAYDGGTFFRIVTPQTSGNEHLPAEAGDLGEGAPNGSVPICVVQAGAAAGWPDFEPIPLEGTDSSGLSHTDGAVSMARGDVATATSELFICLGDQPQLDAGGQRHRDGRGFAVFGAVTAGMDVVRAIHAAPSVGQSLTPPVLIHEVATIAG